MLKFRAGTQYLEVPFKVLPFNQQHQSISPGTLEIQIQGSHPDLYLGPESESLR